MEGVFPQVAFNIFGIPIRDTVISTWVMVALVVAAVAVARRRWPMALEMVVDFLNELISDVMDNTDVFSISIAVPQAAATAVEEPAAAAP